jgi:hypothetical protein
VGPAGRQRQHVQPLVAQDRPRTPGRPGSTSRRTTSAGGATTRRATTTA